MRVSAIRIVTDWYDALARHDLDQIRPLIATDFLVSQTTRLPWGGTYYGPDGFFEYYLRHFSYLDTRLQIEHIFDAGDAVVQVGVINGKVRATGAPVRSHQIDTLELRAGKLTRYVTLVDVPTMLAVLQPDGSTSSKDD
jgi:ketosteroid isomerase-like protein